MLFILCLCFIFYAFHRLTISRTKSSTCLLGKTALITGANSGMGYQTALNLASRGCRVILADIADLTQSKNNIIKFTNNRNIVGKKLDLASLQSVRDFAGDIIKTEERLDILINNAGISASKINRTEDGLQPVMQVNYFGHFLLTHLLIENLNYDSKSEIFSAARIYCNSKLTQMIASDIFASKLKGTGVTSNSVNPGIVHTTLLSQFYSIQTKLKPLKLVTDLYQLTMAKDAWEGSQVIVHCAVSKKLQGVSGEYFWECAPASKPSKAKNREFCREIWDESERLVGLKTEEKLGFGSAINF